MFHFIFDARPKPTNSKFGTYGGTMVSCWVQRDTQSQAEAVARDWIAGEDWAITSMEVTSPITRETQLPAGMQYLEQAEIDGEVFVFHTSSVGAPDDTNAT